MNLLNDRWLPVIRKDESRCKIAPVEITSEYTTNPVIRLDFSRPDFSAFGTQFLIGMFQSALFPQSSAVIEDLLDKPPSEKSLKEVLNPSPFELDGSTHRFMQIANKSEFDIKKMRGVEYLIMGSPGESTTKSGHDWFMKHNDINFLCPSCVAIALYIRQISSFPAGAGYATAYRSGNNGAIITLLTGTTLWETIVFNILERSDLVEYGDPTKPLYPWMNPDLPSAIISKDVHPCHSFWEMPSKIHLNFSTTPGVCSVCGEHGCGVSTLLVANKGRKATLLSYSTTPYSEKLTKNKVLIRRSIQSSETFTEILSGTPVFSKELPSILKYLCSIDDCCPADNVKFFHKKKRQAGLWVFGHHYLKSKYFGWVETELSLLPEIFPGLTPFVEATLSISNILHYYVTRVLGINSFKLKAKGKPKNFPEPLIDFFQLIEPDILKALNLKDTAGILDSILVKAFQVYNSFCSMQEKSLYQFGYYAMVETVNKSFKKLKLGAISVELPRVYPEEKPEKKVLGFSKDLRIAVLKWWGGTNRNIRLRNELKNCISVEEIYDTKAAINLYNICEDYLIANNYGEVYRDRLMRAAQLSMLIEEHHWEKNFLHEVYSSKNSYVTTLSSIQDPLEDWSRVLKLINILGVLNVPNFIETYILWDKKLTNTNRKA